VKYLHFSSILYAYMHCFTAFSAFILHFSHRSRHIPIVLFSPTKGGLGESFEYNGRLLEGAVAIREKQQPLIFYTKKQ